MTRVRILPGVEREIIGYGENLMIARFYLERGAVLPMHQHPHEQATTVIKGKLEFNLEGVESILEAGDALFIPSNAKHEVVALEESLVTDSFTPLREDFLK